MAPDRIVRTYRYRLTPTDAQRAKMAQAAGVCRLVYNLCLDQRRDFWRQHLRSTGRHISYFGQSAEITALRKEFDWIQAVPREALDSAAKDAERAFDRFFRGAGGYPTYRKRSDGCGFSLRGRYTSTRSLNAKWSEARLPGFGWVKFRRTRPMMGCAKIVTLHEDGGEWFVGFQNEIELSPVSPLTLGVGIDRGVANAVALSTGELFQIPASIEALDRRRRKAQRVLSRRVRGSKRREKARARVAAFHARARRMRTDWLHRVSTDISRRFGHVAIEALQIKNMTASASGTVDEPGRKVAQKRGLNRSILAQGWGRIDRMLSYKLAATGGTLARVNPAYTSQSCSACGAVDAKSRESQAVFRCVHCGHEDHADINAAKEILRRSTSVQLVEGARWRPDETRTMGAAA